MSIVNLNVLMNEIVRGDRIIDFDKADMVELLANANYDFITKQAIYSKMYEYYKGDTDAKRKYKEISERSNLFANVNYFKKFVKEEVSYAVGNPITYESLSGNSDLIRKIELNTYHWDENHDSDLMKNLLIFTRGHEIYYRDDEGRFSARLVRPTDGYAYRDFNGNVLFFIYIHTSQFEEDVEEDGKVVRKRRTYYDVYTDKYIYYFDDQYKQIRDKEPHKFTCGVPVSVGVLTYEDYFDSLYSDSKGLQDALETNLSDIANEISDFRNAYLFFNGCTIEDEDLEKFKKRGAIEIGETGGKSDVKWLIKEINDTFIQNSLDRYIDLLYQITNHVNLNEKLQSNLSGVALRSRMIALEQKCTLNINAHKNMVKNRLKFLCDYMNATEIGLAGKYDYRDIKISYTPNIPQDDGATANMLSLLPEGTISKSTSRGLFSFVSNPTREKELCEEEMKQELDLMDDPYLNKAKIPIPNPNLNGDEDE
ncbi:MULTISPECIES: phage portal protein [Clostridia]|uniref:phage portal protein n=1 Tax=Clostridia TaxID=186801 RepID=UPI002A8A4D5B|nr:phage portal protein [Peptostreptococcus porci]MDY5098786.1 phage portal protein [Clostridium sp.]MDY5437451.1 phage portal protein [Peptostreptococcus porci]